MRGKTTECDALEKLRADARRWRDQGRRQLSDALWESAVQLAEEHGISPIAKAIGVSYQAVRNHVKGAQATGESGNQAEFFELDMMQVAAGAAQCVVEFHDSNGAKMVIQMSGQCELDVVALADMFWRAGR